MQQGTTNLPIGLPLYWHMTMYIDIERLQCNRTEEVRNGGLSENISIYSYTRPAGGERMPRLWHNLNP